MSTYLTEWRLLFDCFSVGLHIFPLVSELVKLIEQNSVYGLKSIATVDFENRIPLGYADSVSRPVPEYTLSQI